MFVLDDMLLMSAIGGGLGALTNRKDPLKGGLLGAGLGAGAAALPGLIGGAAQAAAPVANGTLTAVEAAAAPAAASTAAGAAPAAFGTQSMVNLGNSAQLMNGAANTALTAGGSAAAPPSMFQQAMGVMKPVGQAAQAAGAVKSLFPPPQQPAPIQPSPMAQAPSSGPGALAQIAQGNQQAINGQNDMMRQRRMDQLQRMRGY